MQGHKYAVHITGRRKDQRLTVYLTARSEEGARMAGAAYFTLTFKPVHISARLATPRELGCVPIDRSGVTSWS